MNVASLRQWHAFASGRIFLLALALLLGALARHEPALNGDAGEYVLTTIALASHGTPAIARSDVQRARQLAPQLEHTLAALEQGMRSQQRVPLPGFYRGKDGEVYAIHFFAYPALAAVPFKLLQWAGLPPLKCFQLVNLAAVFLLGACLLKLFGHGAKALLGIGLFMLCGGALYVHWASPECLSAAALLAGMILFVGGAPISGAVLAGLASLQNPAIGAFCGFAPVLRLLLAGRPGEGLVRNLRHTLTPRYWLAIGIGCGLFALAPLFSLWQFGVPSVIVKVGGANPRLASLARLQSYYLDLNQGMVIGIPAVLAAVLLWSWRLPPRALRARAAALVAVCAAMTLVLVLPALAIYNWNSDAAGLMRYACWGGMPMLFAFLWCLAQRRRWPARWLAVIGVVGVVQAGAMLHDAGYNSLEFSPTAKWVLARTPALYNPPAEIFAERSTHSEEPLDKGRLYVHEAAGVRRKTLYHDALVDLDARLCGPQRVLADSDSRTNAGGLWRYINGEVQCEDDNGAGSPRMDLSLRDFAAQENVRFQAGWSVPEHGGGNWDGIWSDGPRSRIVIRLKPEAMPTAVLILGHYFEPHERTRVTIDGRDFGWRRLDEEEYLPLERVAGSVLSIELEHEAGSMPAHPRPGERRLAFFINTISLR